MMKIFLVTLGLVIAGFQGISVAGESCSAHKKEAKLKEIKLGEFATKEAKLEAYKKKYGDVSYKELKKLIKKNKVVLIDANKAERYKEAHVTNAVSFHDKKQLEAALPKEKDALIVTYCGGPKCAAWTKVADFAAIHGYTNIKHYSGGIKEWVAELKKKKS